MGLGKVGIFIRRASGEVFLAESDLERFESQRSAVALVIAGNRAGFFVRQADGSIQTIRSHEEFCITPGEEGQAGGPLPSAALRPTPPAGHTPPPTDNNDKRIARPSPNQNAVRREKSEIPRWPRAAAILLAIPLAALAYFRPVAQVPTQLRLAEKDGLVIASWSAAALPHGGKIEIADGANVTSVDVGPAQSNLIYAPRGRSIEVRMLADAGVGPEVVDSATAALHTPVALASSTDEAGALREQVQALQAQSAELQKSLDTGRTRLTDLQRVIDRLTRQKLIRSFMASTLRPSTP